jgi:hypothetical protein
MDVDRIITCFPQTVAREIFGYLSDWELRQCQRVSWTWYAGVKEILWKRLTIFGFWELPGSTHLHLAAEARLVGRFARLMAAESSEEDKNPVDARDFTPLHVAAGNGCREIVDVIVASVSEGCPRDGLQRTPLHWAAMFGHTQIVESLLAVVAEKNPEDGFGHISCDEVGLELACSAICRENGTEGKCKVHLLIVSPKLLICIELRSCFFPLYSPEKKHQPLDWLRTRTDPPPLCSVQRSR